MREDFMRRALDIARQSIDEAGSLPYAAVIVRDGKIVGEGLNRVEGKFDPTSHGEVEAIHAFAMPLPAFVIGELLGLDQGLHASFKRWGDDILSVTPEPPEGAA